MDTTTKSPTSNRTNELMHWLDGLASKHQLDLGTVCSASSDASFRHYYRVHSPKGTVIAMDAPPAQENSEPFVRVTGLLAQHGLNVPAILEQDLEQGFLLLSDLGNQTYYNVIRDGIDDMRLQQLYRDAIGALVQLQTANIQTLAVYNEARLLDELSVFNEWYVQRHRDVQLDAAEQAKLATVFSTLVAHNARSAHVFVHRDFHSPNLMVSDQPLKNPGIIDYQDAIAGPITYDIASLVMDARTTWEEPQQLDWAIRYWEAARTAGLPVNDDFADFHIAYEWMSLQRNLRVLGVFSRLSHRDNKHHYLDHLPRVNAYVRQVAQRYSALTPLLRILDKIDNIPHTVGYTF